MQAISRWTKTVFAAVLLTFMFSLVSEAGTPYSNCSKRPLDEFLDEQGSGSSFFSPVPDYVGWTDGAFTTFALVDYAGLADAYLGGALGTKVRGHVIECPLPSGQAKILVALITTRALGFAQSIQALIDNGFDFLGTPTIFGNKAQDVADGATPAVGPATLLASFTISKDADGNLPPMPDFLDVINNSANYKPVEFRFDAIIVGKDNSGNQAIMKVREAAATDDDGNLVYSEEVIEIVN